MDIRVALRGHPDLIEITGNRTKREATLDNIPESWIVYPDLVFTLSQSPEIQERPIVKYSNGRLVAVANIQYLKALKEAKVKEIAFELIPNKGMILERLMRENNLSYQGSPTTPDYFSRYLFFKCSVPKDPEETPKGVWINPLNDSAEYRKNHCMNYRMSIKDTTMEERVSGNYEFMKAAFEKNGKLRSIDGTLRIGNRQLMAFF